MRALCKRSCVSIDILKTAYKEVHGPALLVLFITTKYCTLRSMSSHYRKSGAIETLPVLLTAWGPSLADGSSPGHILPHTLEAGDPYYIGDVYQKSRIGPSGQWISATSSTSESVTS